MGDFETMIVEFDKTFEEMNIKVSKLSPLPRKLESGAKISLRL